MPKSEKKAVADGDKTVSIVLPVLITEPWQLVLTRMCIEMMYTCTTLPFELVIVESGEHHNELRKVADRYIERPNSKRPTADINVGIAAATGDFIVYLGNDILMRPGWLEALLECFELPDCGAATLSVCEPGAIVGSPEPRRIIIEAMYGPLTMFRKGWKYDEAFQSQHADSDLCMRLYEKGLRAYRNCAVVVHHLYGQTWSTSYAKADRDKITQEANALFAQRYARSPLWMARMILQGFVQFGSEHNVQGVNLDALERPR